MAELQLKVVKRSDNGFMSRAINNFGKAVYSSGGGLYGLLLSAKRNSLLKAYSNYQELTKIPDENKRNAVIKKKGKEGRKLAREHIQNVHGAYYIEDEFFHSYFLFYVLYMS